MAKSTWTVREVLFRMDDGSVKASWEFTAYELSNRWQKLEERSMKSAGYVAESHVDNVA